MSEHENWNPAAGLWPTPREVSVESGCLNLASGLRIENSDSREAARLASSLEALGLLSEGGQPVRLKLDSEASDSDQGYRLTVDTSGVTLAARKDAGLFYGAATLLQLLEDEKLQPRSELRCLTMHDWPRLAKRGFMLDISRDRVPRLDFLLEWVERLAALKLNELQLYMEHTFAYPGHERAWGNSSPFTAEEIRTLDAHCRDLHITLIPNQQSFGHLHRWLKHAEYRHLAEHAEGIEHPFSHDPEPFGLCATDPDSLQFLGELYDSLLPNFTADEFHVGLDEALDLGLGRSKTRCEELGRGKVFTDFLNSVNTLVEARGKRMQFWADEVENDAGLAKRLPSNAIANLWGYEAGHAFDEKAASFREAGLELRVCPGTSSWQSLSGRTQNVLANLREATQAATTFGATGLTICDWGDRGHMQPPPVSELGLAVGTGLAWNPGSADSLDRTSIARLLNRYVFRDASGTLGELFYDLGCVHEPAGGTVQNATALFFLLIHANLPHPHERTQGLTIAGLRESRTLIEELLTRSELAQSKRADADLIRDEARWVLRALHIATRLGEARVKSPELKSSELDISLRTELGAELAAVIAEQRRLWVQRSRPGGLDDSCTQLGRTLAALEVGEN